MIKLSILAVGTFIVSLLGVPTASTTSPVSTTTSTSTTIPAEPLVAPEVVAKWERVAWCETHSNWTRNMPLFDGGLGISRVVWLEYGGDDFAPAPHLATKEEQVAIAVRINGSYVPDENGCAAW